MSIEQVIVVELERKDDERGYFCELIPGRYVPGKGAFGLVYVSQARNPGVIKGNHFHRRKTEWFCVIRGTAELYLCDADGGKMMEVIMGEDALKMVKVPPGVIHAFKNVGPGEMILLAYISEMFDPEDHDTYYRQII